MFMVQFVFRYLRNIDLSFGSQERLASGICIAVPNEYHIGCTCKTRRSAKESVVKQFLQV